MLNVISMKVSYKENHISGQKHPLTYMFIFTRNMLFFSVLHLIYHENRYSYKHRTKSCMKIDIKTPTLNCKSDLLLELLYVGDRITLGLILDLMGFNQNQPFSKVRSIFKFYFNALKMQNFNSATTHYQPYFQKGKFYLKAIRTKILMLVAHYYLHHNSWQ